MKVELNLIRSERFPHRAGAMAALAAIGMGIASASARADTSEDGGRPHLQIVAAATDGSTNQLSVSAGPSHGFAWILAEHEQAAPSAALSAWNAARGIRGTAAPLRGAIVAGVPLDHAGVAVLDLPQGRLTAGTRLRALTLASTGLGSARSSPTVVIEEPGRRGLAGQVRLIVTEFQKDPTTVSDSVGEWIEIYNPGTQPVDISNWILSDLGSESTVLDGGGQRITVRAGRHFVLGRNADTDLNGGVKVDFEYTSFTLSNGEDEIVLSQPDGTVIDQIAYDDGVLWPDEPGRSISLDPDAYDAGANDDGSQWCASRKRLSWGNTNTGTPKNRNEDCR